MDERLWMRRMLVVVMKLLAVMKLLVEWSCWYGWAQCTWNNLEKHSKNESREKRKKKERQTMRMRQLEDKFYNSCILSKKEDDFWRNLKVSKFSVFQYVVQISLATKKILWKSLVFKSCLEINYVSGLRTLRFYRVLIICIFIALHFN